MKNDELSRLDKIINNVYFKIFKKMPGEGVPKYLSGKSRVNKDDDMLGYCVEGTLGPRVNCGNEECVNPQCTCDACECTEEDPCPCCISPPK